MSYKKAADVLPEELIDLIQNYVDGEYVYIPRKQENKKNWGETSKVREELRNRNLTIYREYTMGAGVRELAKRYYLSEKSIQRIVLQLKREIMESSTLD